MGGEHLKKRRKKRRKKRQWESFSGAKGNGLAVGSQENTEYNPASSGNIFISFVQKILR